MRRVALVGGLALVVGASASVLNPVAAIGIMLGLIASVVVLSNPLHATLAFVALLIVRPAAIYPPLAAIQPVKIVAGIAIFSLLVAKLIRGDLSISRAPHGKWMVALFFGVLASALATSARASSLEVFFDSFWKLFLMYGLLVHVVDTKSAAVRIHFTLAACTLGLALFAIHQRMTGAASIEGNRAGFLGGMLSDPNDLALVLLMYVPLFAELALGSRGVRRLLGVVPGAILVTGVLMTVSRGGALGLLVGLVMTFHDRGTKTLRLVLLPALVALVFSLLLVAGVNDRTSGAIHRGQIDESAQGRLDAWEHGVRMVMHNPVLGVGFARFAQVSRNGKDAHNSFVKAAAETGLAGFIPFMALVLLTFRSSYRFRKAEVPQDSVSERAVRRALFAAMCGFCTSAFFLSQCWSWFFFIMFAQSAVIDQIWAPELSSRLDLAHDDQKRNSSALGVA